MSILFKNRVTELKFLENLAREKKPKLVILYGRRRVGKTELLNEFTKRHQALYLLARQESEKEQLRKISEETANFFQDDFLKINPFQNYDALFTYLAQKEVPVYSPRTLGSKVQQKTSFDNSLWFFHYYDGITFRPPFSSLWTENRTVSFRTSKV